MIPPMIYTQLLQDSTCIYLVHYDVTFRREISLWNLDEACTLSIGQKVNCEQRSN